MTSNPLSQSQVRRAISGEREALRAFSLAFLPRVYGLTLRLTKDKHLAEEATQETFLRVFRSLPRLREVERVDSWVLTIASNVVRDMFKRGRRETPLTYEPPAIDTDQDERETVRSKAIERAVAKLESGERELFLLHTVEGLRLRELAELRQKSESAIKAKVHRIRAKVRSQALRELKTVGASL